MRENRLRALLAQDRPLFGVLMNFPTPQEVEFLGHLGFDWVLLDAEHDGLSPREAYPLVMAADHVGMASVVRVASVTSDSVLPFAETGVSGIIAPHVRTAQEARNLVATLAYPPLGNRGAGSARAANYGLTQQPTEYFADTGNHTVPIALLEDKIAYEQLDELVAVDGLDIFCLGTGDLAGSLGIPGRSSDPQVQALATAAAERILAAGKVVGSGVANGAGARASAASGARFIQVSNTGLLAAAGREFLTAARAGED